MVNAVMPPKLQGKYIGFCISVGAPSKCARNNVKGEHPVDKIHVVHTPIVSGATMV